MTAGAYQGVILAAGHGSRMGPFGEQYPNHLGHRITELLGDGSAWGLNIHYVEQKERLGLAHAVGQLEQLIHHPFLLMLGDIFFKIPDLGQMFAEFETHKASAVLAVKQETDIEAVKKNFAVLMNPDGTVRRVIEKPRHVENMLKGCGLYLFDQHIFDAIRRTPRTAMRDEYELTDSIQILIDYEYPVRIASVVDWDMNLTFIEDLITCCTHQLKELGQENLQGNNCTLASGVELVHTVLGDDVIVRHPIRIERCVILPGTTIEDDTPLVDRVIMKDAPPIG
jgi:dTDP-glucose pyrophosphorylase